MTIVAAAAPLTRGDRRAQALTTWIVVATLVAYPLLGTLLVFTDLPSLVASIPVRGIVLLGSVVMLFYIRRSRPAIGLMLLKVFWALYLSRLAWDLFVADIPGAGETLLFFTFTCLIPALALTRVPSVVWDERGLSRWLVVLGSATCLAAILAYTVESTSARSMLDITDRIFFDTVNPITYGHVAVTTLIAALGFSRNRNRWNALLVGIAVVAALVTLKLAESRGPAVALVVCVVAFALLRRRYRWLLLAAGPLFAIILFWGDSGELQGRFETIGEDASTIDRLVVQGNAVGQFLSNPVLGSAYVELDSLDYPHNPFIESAMSLGFVGLLLFATLFFICLRRIVELLRARSVVVPLIALQYLVGAQFSGSLFASSSMWIGIALMLAPARRTAVRKRSSLALTADKEHKIFAKPNAISGSPYLPK